MATSNMNPLRHVARREHRSRIEKKKKQKKKKKERRLVNVTRRQFDAVTMICSCVSAAGMEQAANVPEDN